MRHEKDNNINSENGDELPGERQPDQNSLPGNYFFESEQFIRGAFEQDPRLGCDLLFRRYYVPLCSHAIRFCASQAIAEDLVAEVYLDLYVNNGFKGITTSYRAYLYKAVRHRAYNYLRQALRRDAGLEEASYRSIPENQQPDAIAQYEELRTDMEDALQKLSLSRRKIYLMHRFEGKKYREIAVELGISERTVEVQVRQASHQLRNLLRGKWIDS